MRTLKQQSGMSMFGLLIMMGLFSFFLMVSIRLLPTYMEGRSMKTILEGVAAASNKEEPLSIIKRRIMNSFIANRVEALTPKKVKVYRDKGTVVIDANYEKRIPLFEGVDAVFMFKDHIIVID
jgi:hypothetical protein